MSRFYTGALLLSLGGILFAGYLSLSKALSGTCPFNEPCATFLGYPSCWYGLGLFVFLFLAALAGFFRAADTRCFIRALAFLGILFAGSFVLREAMAALRFGWPDYALFLPTCAYGLFVYVLLFLFAHRSLATPTHAATE
jgi:hypothetical protein